MEPESAAGKASRRAKGIKRYFSEFLLALAFVGAMFVARGILRAEEQSLWLRIVAVALPGLVLTLWFAAYVFAIRAMDELEQAMETRSLAIACGVTLWITTVWGLSTIAFGAPSLPLGLIAPLAAAVFGIVRLLVGVRYR